MSGGGSRKIHHEDRKKHGGVYGSGRLCVQVAEVVFGAERVSVPVGQDEIGPESLPIPLQDVKEVRAKAGRLIAGWQVERRRKGKMKGKDEVVRDGNTLSFLFIFLLRLQPYANGQGE